MPLRLGGCQRQNHEGDGEIENIYEMFVTRRHDAGSKFFEAIYEIDFIKEEKIL